MKNVKEEWINDYRIKIIKTLQIQRHWRYYSCNPQYKLAQQLCKLRLEQVYDDE